MRPVLALALAPALALVLILTAPHASAQAAGAVVVTLNGADIKDATTTSQALGLDAGAPALLVARITAPTDASWHVRAVRVTLVAGALGGAAVPALARELPVDEIIAPGETLVVEREADLSPLRTVGAGVFRMEAEVLDAEGNVLSSTPFFVRVAGQPLLTVVGAVALVLSGVAAYGLWQLLRDLREFHAAWQRHRKEEREEGRVAKLAGAAIDLSAGAEGVLAMVEGADKEAARLSRRRSIAWTLTGLGLGGVAISWAQALGAIPIDLGTLLLGALGGALALLMLSLLAAAWTRRLRRKARAAAANFG